LTTDSVTTTAPANGRTGIGRCYATQPPLRATVGLLDGVGQGAHGAKQGRDLARPRYSRKRQFGSPTFTRRSAAVGWHVGQHLPTDRQLKPAAGMHWLICGLYLPFAQVEPSSISAGVETPPPAAPGARPPS
jgi:hypothetical protein